MAPPRSVNEIKRQLADLTKIKSAAQTYGVRDFASEVGMETVFNHEGELLEELRAAEMLASKDDAELVLDGEPVRDHTVPANVLGAFLTKLQELVNAIAQVVTSVPTSRAPVARNIVTENRLLVTGWMPSSFAVRLRLPTKEELGQIYEPESQAVLDRLTEVLREDAPSGSTLNLVSSPRVKKHYYELLDAVAKQGAVVRLRTRRTPYGVRVDAKQARDRVEWLDLLQVKEDTLTHTGVLVGGNIESGRFELRVQDDIYRGKVSEAAKAQMRDITFGTNVRARLRVTTTIHEEGVMEPATSYFLDRIEVA